MSHFTVLVVGENVDEQLHPFWELDLNEDEIKMDSRAQFFIEIKKDELEKKFAAACALMAFESHERYADAGPVQVGIVGGEVMEFGKQRGVTQIPF